MNSKMNRRKFLAAVGVGGAAAAAAVTQVGGERERSAEAGQSQDKRHGQGYQVTEHVRRYYETTKV